MPPMSISVMIKYWFSYYGIGTLFIRHLAHFITPRCMFKSIINFSYRSL